jgi:hypothetical protein
MVAAHMMNAGEQSTGQVLSRSPRQWFALQRHDGPPARAASAKCRTQEIIERIRASTTTTNKPPAATMAMLGEVVVHGNDIRQPLGIDDDSSTRGQIGLSRDVQGSNFPVPAKKAIAGLSLKATDADWSFGTGPLVNGPLVASSWRWPPDRSPDLVG